MDGGTSGATHRPGLPVLVFDDHPDTAALLVEILTEEGLAAVASTCPVEVLRRLGREAFSLVLADYLIGTPEESEQLAGRLLELATPTPVGCISAWEVPERLRSAYAFVMNKPLSSERVVSEVARLMV